MLRISADASDATLLRTMSLAILAPHYEEWRRSMGMDVLSPTCKLKHAIINCSRYLVGRPPALLRLCVGVAPFAGGPCATEEFSFSPSGNVFKPPGCGQLVVLVTFGSMVALGLAFPTESQLQLISQVAFNCDARCILHVRTLPDDWDEALARYSAVPFQVVVGEVEHACLLSRCDVIIHHGGAGTCHAAAVGGVAQVVVAHAFDQAEWATRIQELGLGYACDRSDSVEMIVAATKSAIALKKENSSTIEHMRSNIRHETPLEDATEIITFAIRSHLQEQLPV
jgi:UDP-N-acetylglucosamine:LPS N-acetylglucosamine transferase